MAQQFTADSATWPSVISSGLSSGQAEIQVGNWGAEGADHDLGVNGQLLIGTLTLKAAAAGNATVSVDPDSLIAVTTLNDQTLTSSAPISYQILPLTRCERGRRFCDALLARVLR